MNVLTDALDLMMESGLEEEVRFLKDRGVSSTSTAMQGLWV